MHRRKPRFTKTDKNDCGEVLNISYHEVSCSLKKQIHIKLLQIGNLATISFILTCISINEPSIHTVDQHSVGLAHTYLHYILRVRLSCSKDFLTAGVLQTLCVFTVHM